MLYSTIRTNLIPDACGREKENIRLKSKTSLAIKKKKVSPNFVPFPIQFAIVFCYQKIKAFTPQKRQRCVIAGC